MARLPWSGRGGGPAALPPPATDWKGKLESVAIGLLTLEVNTIRKCGMSAQKMPDVPIALHSIVDSYNDYLSRLGFGVDTDLLHMAENRIRQHPPPPPDQWFEKLMAWRPAAVTVKMRSVDLTNGAKSFEALRWAAAAALLIDNDEKRKSALGDPSSHPLAEETRAVVARIMANCRQLTPAVLDLERLYEVEKQRLADAGTPATAPLIGGTLEETAHACFDGGQELPVSLKVAVLVRKIWDIGTETVLAQTSVQVDGDVVTRVSPAMLEDHPDFLLGLHNSALQTGLAQWKALFDLVSQLIGGLADRLFKAL